VRILLPLGGAGFSSRYFRCDRSSGRARPQSSGRISTTKNPYPVPSLYKSRRASRSPGG